jgi:negative regulator of flagellin synthesis FlgM
MYRHGPTGLAGPVSKARVIWVWSESDATETETITLEPQELADPLSSRADIRLDLVQRVRREIAEGVYDTPDKFEAALDRLLDCLDP